MQPAEGGAPPEDPNRTFARFLVRDLVRREEGRGELRARLLGLVLGAALACLCLAWPCERLIGRGPELVGALAERGLSLRAVLEHGLFAPLGAWLAHAAGASLEAGAFLASACALGLCVPALARLGRAVGGAPLAALAAAVLTCLTPLAWLAGTLPGAAAPGLLGATLVWAAAFAPPARRARALGVALALGALCSPAVLALAPLAVAAAAGAPARAGATRGGHARLAGLFAASLLGVLGLQLALGSPDALAARERALAAGLALGGAGLGALAVAGLSRAPKDPESARAPSWMLAALVPWALAARTPALAPELFALALPCAAIGFLHGPLAFGEPGRARAAAALAALHLALGAACVLWIARADPERTWREHARAALAPGDRVRTPSARREYLLRQRFGLAAGPLGGALDPPGAGRRVLDDAPPGDPRGAGGPGAPEAAARQAELERAGWLRLSELD